jgi:glycosyltransferase involved in cell wall biosynthesis
MASDMQGSDWTQPGRRKHWWGKGPAPKEGLDRDWLDLMVVTSPDSLTAFKALDDKVPYTVVPNGIDTEQFDVIDRRDRKGPFRFFSIGMLAGRKDPFATLAAWEMAQQMDPEFDAELILKTGTTGLHPKIAERYRNVQVIAELWPRHMVKRFYADVDCLVSTSRGEGNNKPAMEFMATGGAVMATDWGGHRNWLHDSSGYPLPGALEPIGPGSPISDFRVDVEATARTFLHVWRNQREAHEKGVQAAARIRADLSWEKVCDRFMRRSVEVM